MTTINVFHLPLGSGEDPEQLVEVSGLRIAPEGFFPAETYPGEESPPSPEALVSILAIDRLETPEHRACAVALVPAEYDRQLRVRGVEVRAGVTLLSHGDELLFGDRQYWISAEPSAAPVSYDPEVHPEEFCFRTKRRLVPGDAVVVCPGTAGRSCGLIYTEGAWGSGLHCPECGHDPSQGTWTPPRPRRARSVQELLSLIDDTPFDETPIDDAFPDTETPS